MSGDPTPRRRLLLLAPAGLLAAGLAGTAGWLLTREEPPILIGGPFELVDGAGRTVTDRTFLGKWMLVYFGFTRCPDVCPTALQNMASARDLLGPAYPARVNMLGGGLIASETVSPSSWMAAPGSTETS